MATPDMIISDPAAIGALTGGIVALGIVFVFLLILLLIAIYVYTSLAMMKTAQRLKTPNPWLAWIPIGNMVLMSQMAKMPWWPVLLLVGTLIPFVGWLFWIAFMVFFVIWLWKICERRNKPNWWAVLVIIPVVGWIWALVLWGILAWGE